MEHVATVIPYTAEDGYRWKAACTCGWQSTEQYPSEEAAMAMAETHVKQS
jgi:hypothetical protein